MKKTLVILLILGLAGSALGQSADEAKLEEVSRAQSLGIKPAVRPFSLIDLSRVKWSHSYSVSYFSGGGYSGSMGLYNSSVFYELSSKLSLTLNIGLSHSLGGSLWADENSDAIFLPGFRLDYHPSDKFRMTLGFQRYSGYYLPYYYPRYYDPLIDF
ncbi:MAG: hypothetical protein JSW34_05360 [Candidatus Zixiibacteriota bacterium]|nr:MAG: hypothetical protein JSW34_05360 [candidate division Zixibacteria bacterium]